MDKDKSILEKITDTIKDIANIAADAADHALKAEPLPPSVDQRAAAYIPLAADGLVSDPMMVPPLAATPAPRRKRAASTRAAKQDCKKGCEPIGREGKKRSQEVKERCQKHREENQQENREDGAQGNSLKDPEGRMGFANGQHECRS